MKNGNHMKQLPDKLLAKPGRLPSDIDGDMSQKQYEEYCNNFDKECPGCNGRLGWYDEDIWVACLSCNDGRANFERIEKTKAHIRNVM